MSMVIYREIQGGLVCDNRPGNRIRVDGKNGDERRSMTMYDVLDLMINEYQNTWSRIVRSNRLRIGSAMFSRNVLQQSNTNAFCVLKRCSIDAPRLA